MHEAKRIAVVIVEEHPEQEARLTTTWTLCVGSNLMLTKCYPFKCRQTTPLPTTREDSYSVAQRLRSARLTLAGTKHQNQHPPAHQEQV